MSDSNERLAVLETKMEQYETDIKEIKKLITTNTKANTTRWEEISQFMSKQKGFIGGIVLVVSSVWAVALAGLQYFKP